MNRGIAITTWHRSLAVARAWTTSFGTKQNWLSNCMTFILQMKRVMTLKPGLFSVKAKDYRKFNTYCTKKLKFFFKKEKIGMSFTYESNIL